MSTGWPSCRSFRWPWGRRRPPAGCTCRRCPAGARSGSFVAPWAREEFVEVATVRLDDLVATRAPDGPLRVVKIDIEGFEAEMLAGAQATLTDHRPVVICEFHDPLLRAAGSSSEDLLRAFAAYGYRFLRRPSLGRPGRSTGGSWTCCWSRP